MQKQQSSVLRLAVILIVLVMATAVFITFTGMADRNQFSETAVWQIEAQTADSINITDMTGDGERDVFVQQDGGFAILDANGNSTFAQNIGGDYATTQGDVNGDGTPDVVAFIADGRVLAYTGDGMLLWQTQLGNVGAPGRILALDFENDGRSEVIAGDMNGLLIALSADGERLWNYQMDGNGTLRGLDEAQLPNGDVVTAGLDGGTVVTLNKNGREMWQTQASGGLRRLRAFPLGSPIDGHIFVGGVGGTLAVHRPDDGGQLIWSDRVGQAVNEIRPGEADGDPSTTEVLVGGKDGGVWAFAQDGRQLWSDSVGAKVAEIATLNLPDFGNVILFGDDGGDVTGYSPSGDYLFAFDAGGGVLRLEEGKLGPERGIIVSNGRSMTFYKIAQQTAPFWYSPLIAGLVASGIITIVSYMLMGKLQPAPTLQLDATEMSTAAQRAQRRMLHESIHDLKDMFDQGNLSSKAYLARLKTLRAQLAKANENLMTLGEDIQVETIVCPHCNGTLSLGTDTCDYCGQIVIS